MEKDGLLAASIDNRSNLGAELLIALAILNQLNSLSNGDASYFFKESIDAFTTLGGEARV